MSKLLFFLFVIVAIAVVGDIAAKRYVESRLAGEFEDSASGADVDVDVGGFPFLPGALSGTISDLRVQVEGFHSKGVRIELLDVTLEKLRFDLSETMEGGLEDVRARTAVGTVTLPGSEVDALLEDQGAPVDINIQGGRAAAEGQAVDLAVEGTNLVLEVPAPIGTVEVPLPTPMAGVSYGRLDIDGTSLVLGFRIRDPELALT